MRHLWSVAYLVVLVLLKIIKNQYLNYAMKPIRKLKEEAKSGIKAIRNIYIYIERSRLKGIFKWTYFYTI